MKKLSSVIGSVIVGYIGASLVLAAVSNLTSETRTEKVNKEDK